MNDAPRRFLLPMWDGGGTVAPGLGVARRLLARGHAVHVLADPTIGDEAERAGCAFTPWTRAPHRTSRDPDEDLLRDWETANPLAMLARIRDRFIAGPAEQFAADTGDTIDLVHPDVVAPDYLLFGAIIAAQAANVPVVPIVPNIWTLPSPGVPAIGPGLPLAKGLPGRWRDAALRTAVNALFRRGLPPLNAARARRGLAPLRSFYDQVLDTPRIVVLASPGFDFASPSVPANVTYTGAILDEPAWAAPWSDDSPRPASDPLVLVGFSSTYQQQASLLQRTVDALSSLPVRGVVTLGPMLRADDVNPAPNVAVLQSAQHGAILRKASLAITHCGHGTVMKALANGVPMVCVPMGRDQNDTAARVVHHGAGVRLSPRSSAAGIAAAVREVLGDPRYRDNAERMSRIIADEVRTADVVDEIEAVADDCRTSERLTEPHYSE
jgi:UDP:flavonoid glycosyltransferase YjiC (YdhE family)